MSASTPDWPRAFRELERALARRRLAALDPLLRVELLALAVLVAGFVFWQVRVLLSNAAYHAGALGAARELAMRLGVLIAAGAALAASAHARALGAPLPGPPWLSLPIPAARIHQHARWKSALHSLWMLPPAAGALLAGVRVIPVVWLLLIAIATPWGLVWAARMACELVARLAVLGVRRRPGVPSQVALLSRASTVTPSRPAPAARWTRGPAWLALLRKDARIVRRPGPARRRLLVALACTCLAAIAWWLPGAGAIAPLLAFGLALLAAGQFAQWLIALVNSDPPPALRPLPVGLGAAWGARVAWASLAALTLATTQAVASTSLEPASRQLLVFAVGTAAFAIGVLAVNYAISLYPRAADADQLFLLSCGLALAGSIMIPLLGWIVLLSAVLHSLRRISRWRLAERA